MFLIFLWHHFFLFVSFHFLLFRWDNNRHKRDDDRAYNVYLIVFEERNLTSFMNFSIEMKIFFWENGKNKSKKMPKIQRNDDENCDLGWWVECIWIDKKILTSEFSLNFFDDENEEICCFFRMKRMNNEMLREFGLSWKWRNFFFPSVSVFLIWITCAVSEKCVKVVIREEIYLILSRYDDNFLFILPRGWKKKVFLKTNKLPINYDEWKMIGNPFFVVI